MISNFIDSVGADEEGDYYSQFYLTFLDDANEKNYYEIFIKHILFSEDEAKNGSCFSNDPIIVAEGLNDYNYYNLVFSDTLFNGKNKTFIINYSPILYNTGSIVDPNYKIIVYFRNISENYYKYKKKMVVHLSGQEFDFWAGTGDPVQMFSNVLGGYGIYAGYTESIDIIQKQK